MFWTPDSDPTLVAVKILKLGVSSETRSDFKCEADIMSTFDHPNIVRLLGVVAIGRFQVKVVKCARWVH